MFLSFSLFGHGSPSSTQVKSQERSKRFYQKNKKKISERRKKKYQERKALVQLKEKRLVVVQLKIKIKWSVWSQTIHNQRFMAKERRYFYFLKRLEDEMMKVKGSMLPKYGKEKKPYYRPGFPMEWSALIGNTTHTLNRNGLLFEFLSLFFSSFLLSWVN